MPKALILSAESAVANLDERKDWYSEQGVPNNGSKIFAEIIEKVEALRDYLDKGRIVPEFDQHFLRELLHPPYRIVYQREPRFVRIVRIRCSERTRRLP